MRFSERKKDLTQIAERVSGVRDYNRTVRTRRRLGRGFLVCVFCSAKD